MKPSTSHYTEPPGRSWRTIRQEVSTPAMSRKGRRRQVGGWMKIALMSASVVLAGLGIFAVLDTWATDRTALDSAVHNAPVREVVLITDGVLTQKWTAGVLSLPKPVSLLALNLPVLRDRLLAYGQVRSAVLTRKFPDTLIVTLHEQMKTAC